jgi:DNA-binding NarL/FixJ family response regulator
MILRAVAPVQTDRRMAIRLQTARRMEPARTRDSFRETLGRPRPPNVSRFTSGGCLASQVHSNPEIAAQRFISPRTVEHHLRGVFATLGITSRKQLASALD